MNGADAEARDRVLADLYDIEHLGFGHRLGLMRDRQKEIPEELLRRAVHVLDDLSLLRDQSEWISTIVALLWEYLSSAHRASLRSFLILVLTRSGLSPSTYLIDTPLVDTSDGLTFRYSSTSFREEVAITLLQVEVEVVIGGSTFVLSAFQKELLEKVEKSNLVCVSAPTSAGKSFALNLCIARYAHAEPLPIVYVVPTISLVNQVSRDIRQLFRSLGLEEWSVATSATSLADYSVYVLTQERAINIFGHGGYDGRLGMLIVDEVQNLERISEENDLRSKILFDFMRDSRGRADKVVISGPRLDDVGLTGESVFDVSAEEIKTTTSPVANLTYSIAKHNGAVFLTQHRDLLEKDVSVRIDEPDVVQGSGQSRYTDAFLGYLSFLLQSLGDESRNIIFSPTAEQARKTAVSLSGFMGAHLGAADRLSLSGYLGDYVHPSYDLVSCVTRGVAFHSGRVPPHARLAIEQAFSEGILKDVACTTTLMQGVNLPATIVLIRNPRLAINQRTGGDSTPSLSAYDFANLRGRAGRLSKDFIGRTVALDEESFVSGGQEDLFSAGRKTIKPGYGELFALSEDDVLADLRRPQPDTSGTAKFLAGYIRQVILRHGEGAGSHLRSIGVSLAPADLDAARTVLEGVTVDAGLIMKHRYWDPVDLQVLYDTLQASEFVLPSDVWARNLASSLADVLKFMKQTMPYYYSRHLGTRDSPAGIFAVAKAAESWCREVPLRKIIDLRRFDSHEMSEKIDDQMGLIFREVVYALPSLLRPVFDLSGVGDRLLSSIEAGAYSPVTFFLMSLGLYRETAVALRNAFASEFAVADEQSQRVIISRVRAGFSSLDPWTQRQVLPVLESSRH